MAIRGNEDHEKACKDHGIDKIDLLVVNLYPFQVINFTSKLQILALFISLQSTVAKGADFDNCVENIDIGMHDLHPLCLLPKIVLRRIAQR